MQSTDIDLGDIIEDIAASSAKGGVSPAGLRFNPFPVTGIGGTGDEPVIPPLDDSVTRQVREFLRAALSSHSFTGMVVTGDFGFGKTHLLRWIERVVNTSTARVNGGAVRAYYVSNPGIRPMEVLMAVTRAIGQEEFRKMIWTVVAADLRARLDAGGLQSVHDALTAGSSQSLFSPQDDQLRELMQPDVLDSLGKFYQLYTSFTLSERALREHVWRALATVTDNLDVVRALTSVLLDDDLQAFSSWVSLISVDGRQQLRVPQPDYFAAILEIVKRNGIATAFLLIDEFEDAVGMRLTSRAQAEYLATLRLLIDAHVEDFSLVIALAPQAWEKTKDIYPAFTDRMNNRVVNLRPLDVARATELVRRYLRTARDQRVEDGASDGLAPFTTEAVNELAKLTGGNTRAFVSACYRVLQHCWEENSVDAAAVRSVIGA